MAEVVGFPSQTGVPRVEEVRGSASSLGDPRFGSRQYDPRARERASVTRLYGAYPSLDLGTRWHDSRGVQAYALHPTAKAVGFRAVSV
jgi:hypothetical protein